MSSPAPRRSARLAAKAGSIPPPVAPYLENELLIQRDVRIVEHRHVGSGVYQVASQIFRQRIYHNGAVETTYYDLDGQRQGEVERMHLHDHNGALARELGLTRVRGP